MIRLFWRHAFAGYKAILLSVFAAGKMVRYDVVWLSPNHTTLCLALEKEHPTILLTGLYVRQNNHDDRVGRFEFGEQWR